MKKQDCDFTKKRKKENFNNNLLINTLRILFTLRMSGLGYIIFLLTQNDLFHTMSSGSFDLFYLNLFFLIIFVVLIRNDFWTIVKLRKLNSVWKNIAIVNSAVILLGSLLVFFLPVIFLNIVVIVLLMEIKPVDYLKKYNIQLDEKIEYTAPFAEPVMKKSEKQENETFDEEK